MTNFDGIIQSSFFLSYSKNYTFKFKQAYASLIISLPFVLLNLEKVERKRKKYKNLNTSTTKRAFRRNKKYFSVLEELSSGAKIRIL